ncbi:MAG: hypothetical protein JJ992_26565, partial [Planctomycetes bacterium]|nr:hypothetical protein [Planctomycetota bacterium]
MQRIPVFPVVPLVLLGGRTSAEFPTPPVRNMVNRHTHQAKAHGMVDVDKLMASPLAKEEGWRGKLEQSFSSGLLILPPQCGRFMLSSQLDFQTFKPLWEVAVLDVKYEASV